MTHPYKEIFDGGEAIGFHSIKDDTVTYIFRGEIFVIPSSRLESKHLRYDGHVYRADIGEIRKLQEM